MMARLRAFVRNQRGATAVEFAMLAPVLLSMIIGAAQMGILFFANAGLQHAIGEGARLAMIFPRPSATEIQERVRSSRYGLHADYLVGDPTVNIVDVADPGADYADISWSYRAPLNFIFFETRPVTLNYTRRAYLQAASVPGGGGGTSTGGTTTGGTTTGGTTTGGTTTGGTTTGGTTTGGTTTGGTTTGGTTTGGDASTSGGSTTTSTSGGSTTSTSTSSTSTSTSGGNGNASSGNGKGSDKAKENGKK